MLWVGPCFALPDLDHGSTISKDVQRGGGTTDRQRDRIPRKEFGGCDPDFLHTLAGKDGNRGEVSGIQDV